MWRRGVCCGKVRRSHLSAACGGTHTVAAGRFPAPDGAANRAASSKPARFSRRWRRVAGFPLKGRLWTVQNKKAPLEGMGFPAVPFGQGFKDMSPPTKKLMKLVLEQMDDGQHLHPHRPWRKYQTGQGEIHKEN